MSKTIARLCVFTARAVTAWQRPFRQSNTLLRISNLLHRTHTVETVAGRIAFRCTHPQELDYPAQLFTREPETIDWLNGLDGGSLLWDVGANVGAYALYAARRGAKVWAFEPAPASFSALAENIRQNELFDRIVALPIALGSSGGLQVLEMAATNPGSVMHNLRTSGGTGGHAVLSFSADEFRRAYHLPMPTHMKVDVDGIEAEILSGAREIISSPSFRSLIIEIPRHATTTLERIIQMAGTAGLRFTNAASYDGHYVENAQFHR